MSTIKSRTSTSVTAASPLFQAAPPANALIPTPPQGFVPSKDTGYAGVVPRLSELGALPGAITDLKAFTDYLAALGGTAPPPDEVIAAFTLAEQWSSMRKASALWDVYAQMQEGIAWSTVRPMMETLAPAFALATTHNPSLATRFASLHTLLTARKAIARKAASTRALNRKASAEGKPPIHGKAGRQRQKATDKAIVAAAGGAIAPAAPPTSAIPSPTGAATQPSAASLGSAAPLAAPAVPASTAPSAHP